MQLLLWQDIRGVLDEVVENVVIVLHCAVEVHADWPVKPSSPLSTVAHTSAASHYRSAISH